MALMKKIKKPNGLVLEYHRIAMVKIDTNQQCTILVESYLNEDCREYEKSYARGEIQNPIFPYTDNEYVSFDYDENMSVKNAYEWLKQQPDFEGAEDV